MPDLDPELPWKLAQLAGNAGAAVMEVYASGVTAREKTDGSPVTAADERAEKIILDGLRALAPGVAVLAEEQCSAVGFGDVGERFFLVDPLDGTREFLSRTDEFTVNIALIEKGAPTMGCVYAPALERLYFAGAELGARVALLKPGAALAPESCLAVHARERPAAGLVALASRSHLDARTTAFLSALPVVETRGVGSSLKFCLIAEGGADVYPRFGPTMEWDIAAGQAILEAAGGAVLDEGGGRFRYGKRDKGYLNGPFVAWGRAP